MAAVAAGIIGAIGTVAATIPSLIDATKSIIDVGKSAWDGFKSLFKAQTPWWLELDEQTQYRVQHLYQLYYEIMADCARLATREQRQEKAGEAFAILEELMNIAISNGIPLDNVDGVYQKMSGRLVSRAPTASLDIGNDVETLKSSQACLNLMTCIEDAQMRKFENEVKGQLLIDTNTIGAEQVFGVPAPQTNTIVINEVFAKLVNSYVPYQSNNQTQYGGPYPLPTSTRVYRGNAILVIKRSNESDVDLKNRYTPAGQGGNRGLKYLYSDEARVLGVMDWRFSSDSQPELTVDNIVCLKNQLQIRQLDLPASATIWMLYYVKAGEWIADDQTQTKVLLDYEFKVNTRNQQSNASEAIVSFN